jgi:hypothetical protein
MAEFANGRARRGPVLRRRARYTGDDIALRLGYRRDRLVDQVPIELAAARGLTYDDWALAVDQAIDYLVTEYDVPIWADDELERAFWKAAGIRIKRLRGGRFATVRGNWTRVDMATADIASSDGDPEAEAIRHSEQGARREFAATLTEGERRLLDAKYEGRKVKGHRVLARELRLTTGEVRGMEASIDAKLGRFTAIMAAGTLCTHRQALLATMGTERFSEQAERVALAHLDWCPACRVEYAARVRAWRSGQLEREIAGLLPLQPTVEHLRTPRALWDALTEWIGRPAAHETTVNCSQVGIATRGVGTVAAAKLAAMCIGGITIVGGSVYCLHGPLAPQPPVARVEAERPKPRATRTPTPSPTAAPTFALARATASPTPKPRKLRPKAQPQRPKSPTAHERERAISPAPAGAAPNGESEFGPVLTQSSNEPAPAVTSGGPEFP